MNHEPHCPPDALCIWCREESLKARLEEVSAERDEARESLTDLLKLMLPHPAGEPALVADTPRERLGRLVYVCRRCGEEIEP